jgi:uncharacterized protein (DUF1499 family)
MKWLVALLAVPAVLIAGGLAANRPSLTSPPGPVARLKTYLTTNVAATRPEHPFPELRTPHLDAEPERVRQALVGAMRELGWQDIVEADGELRAVVVSPLFRFRDDLTIRLEGAGGGTLVHARSASRVGQGDLAANARHLQELFAALQSALSSPDADWPQP